MAILTPRGVVLSPAELPDDWQHFCDLCRTPQEDLYEHQLVCPDALAYALHTESLGIREYWAVTGDTWSRRVVRVLGRPCPASESDGRVWYRWWTSSHDLRGPTVDTAKTPRKGPLVLDEWMGSVGSGVYSLEAHALAAARREIEVEIKWLQKRAEVLRAGQATGRRRYRKADEALVVHRQDRPAVRAGSGG